jgi:polyisoprenoid-binding protein YceI
MSATSAVARTHTWHFDTSHTEAGFAVRHLMISTVKGHFHGVTGSVTTEDDDFTTAKVDLTIDATTVNTRDIARDAHLRSADFFDVERFPALTFKSRTVKRSGKDRYTVTGELSIRGVTREVSLDVDAHGLVKDPWGNEKAGFSATGQINRKDFGLVWNMALETGGVLVGDDVKLHLDVELTRQKAE